MRKTTRWRPLVLAAVCLTALAPAMAAEAPAAPEAPPAVQRELTAEEQVWLALPNGRTDRLERYAAWAALHPEAAPEAVVLAVNMDLDRPVYENVQTAEDPDSLTVLVNKRYALPAGYVPELEVLGSPYGWGSLRPEAAQAFRAMADQARAEGIALRSVSAYRSYQHQSNTYNRYLAYNRQAVVDTFSARPGHSEHQTGLALDINVASTAAHFERTPAYAWLQAHCAEYGFILRYAQGKEDITGYCFEPWHYRYVGVETARSCMENGWTYEEYLALQPETPAVPETELDPETEPTQETEPVPEGEAVPETEPVPEAAPAPTSGPIEL